MAQLTVLLGAGASFDCAAPGADAVRHYRPPLVGELFESRQVFGPILRKYPRAEALAAEIRSKLDKVPLERQLKQASADKNVVVRQLYREVPLYLQELLGEVSHHYIRTGATHFHTLILQIARRVPDKFERVLFLTLNYDLFLEKALATIYGHEFSTLASYVPATHAWSLVKLHGSVDWGLRVVGAPPDNDTCKALSRIDGDLELDAEIRMLRGWQNRVMDERLCYPALAAPLEGKSGFVCPRDHVEFAERFIEASAHLVVIGCSLLDEDVLELFAGTRALERLLIANGSPDSGREALDRLAARNALFRDAEQRDPSSIHDGGFGQLITSGRLEGFLDA